VGTAGDGVLATFDGPARGIRCARSIADAVVPLGVQVRTGLHTGECEMFGSDVGGIAVHTAAPVAALAQPGEVLVSHTVKDLVAGSRTVSNLAARTRSRAFPANGHCLQRFRSPRKKVRSLVEIPLLRIADKVAGPADRFPVISRSPNRCWRGRTTWFSNLSARGARGRSTKAASVCFSIAWPAATGR
jgi:hypothetical protein